MCKCESNKPFLPQLCFLVMVFNCSNKNPNWHSLWYLEMLLCGKEFLHDFQNLVALRACCIIRFLGPGLPTIRTTN